MKTHLPVRIPRRWRRAVPLPRGWKGSIEFYARHAVSWMFAFFFLLVVIGIPGLLAVTSIYGLGEFARTRVEQALSGNYYSVELRNVFFNPLHGFVLEGLRIRDRTPDRRLLVSADRIGISVNMESLLKRSPRPERIFLRDTTLDIPVGPRETPRMQFDHVRAVILCTPDEVGILRSSFRTSGIEVHVSGSFRNPKAFSPKPVSSSGPGKTADTIVAVQKALSSLRWEGVAPILTVQAGGDLADTDSLRIDRAVLKSGPGSWREASFRSLDAQLSYVRRQLVLERFRLDQGMGMLRAAGRADFALKKASLEFSGSLGLGGITRSVLGSEKSAPWEWIDPLTLSGELAASWVAGSPILSGTAQAEVGRFLYHGVGVDRFSAGMALRDGKFLIRDFHVSGNPGSIDGDLLLAPGDNRLRFRASLRPEKLAPLTGGKSREALESLFCEDPLTISFDGGAPSLDAFLIKGEGKLGLGKASMRGSAIAGLSSAFVFADGAVDFREILLRRPEGSATGEFVYDYQHQEGRFPGVRSSADPAAIMMWIDPRIAKTIRDYRFVSPPATRLSGKVGLKDPLLNDLFIEVHAPSGLGYTLIGRNLPFGPTSGTVRLKGQTIMVDLPKSRLFEGDVRVKAQASVAPGDGRFSVSAGVDEIDFRTLTKLYFGYDESGGKLSGTYDFTMTGGQDLTMAGKGSLLIKDGKVLAMPVLGPLSILLNDIIPGVGYQTAKKATADFTVADGIIDTRDILIQGTGFSMLGNGKIHYLEDRMEMNMRLNAQGLPGVVLFPVSKILEYESVGSAKHPKWRPKILPKIGSGTPQASPSPTPTP